MNNIIAPEKTRVTKYGLGWDRWFLTITTASVMGLIAHLTYGDLHGWYTFIVVYGFRFSTYMICEAIERGRVS